MGLFTDALHFAVDAHGDARRKGDGAPAILHATEAASIAATLTTDERVEDAGVLPDEIRERFGDRVAELVAAETEDTLRDRPASETWRRRKEQNMRSLLESDDRDVAIVFLSDKLSNMRSFYRHKVADADDLW